MDWEYCNKKIIEDLAYANALGKHLIEDRR